MSDPTDIKALDEYLKGNSDVTQRYRELGRDEVPPELDRRVLAAAREAVANERAQRSRSWMRWSAPLALAASVVLVVTVVLERGVQDETVPLQQSAAEVAHVRSDVAPTDKAANAVEEESKRAEEVAQEYAREVQTVRQQSSEEALAKAVSKTKAENQPSFAPPPPKITVETQSLSSARQSVVQESPVTAASEVPAAAPAVQAQEQGLAANDSIERSEVEADSSTAVQEVAVTGSRNRRVTGRAGPRDTISTGSFANASRPAADEQREPSDPQAWLEDIRAMRRAGKSAEADREWERFRAAFPDVQVADDDLARKKP